MNATTPSFGFNPSTSSSSCVMHFEAVVNEQDGDALTGVLVKKCPPKLDIGPVYNVDPDKRATYKGMQLG